MKFENNGHEIILDDFSMIDGQYRVIDYSRVPTREWVFNDFESAKKTLLRRVAYSLNIYLEEFSRE